MPKKNDGTDPVEETEGSAEEAPVEETEAIEEEPVASVARRDGNGALIV